VAGARLVFAPRVPLAEHLARQRNADLFLDTLPCNAHTTASDALWVGLPVLTCLGHTFAGRVAGSLLRAVGLPELVTSNLAQYEALAVRLGTRDEELGALRERLRSNRVRCALFDGDWTRRHLEAAYRTMRERSEAGLPPAEFSVPPGALEAM
jgi:predicted O-linked N-acetylglucosamine transferase (SPINDLY family)